MGLRYTPAIVALFACTGCIEEKTSDAPHCLTYGVKTKTAELMESCLLDSDVMCGEYNGMLVVKDCSGSALRDKLGSMQCSKDGRHWADCLDPYDHKHVRYDYGSQ